MNMHPKDSLEKLDAPRATKVSLAKGKVVYQEMQCAKCHGETGRGENATATDLKDSQGRNIKAYARVQAFLPQKFLILV